ncbi:MAG: G1 family glutamic endopeptidase [Acidimicrobiales bacterium]
MAEQRWWTKVVVALGVGSVVGVLPGVAGVTGAATPTTASTPTTPPAAFVPPAFPVTEGPLSVGSTTQATSRNWDGYVTLPSSTSPTFAAVSATWVQPTVTCEATQAWTVFWVGLDGWGDGTVEQGGSSAYCPTAGGPATYQLWWEMYPTNDIRTVLTIAAGDTIHAVVTYEPTTSEYVIRVRDVTSGKGFTRKELCGAGFTCNRASAEAITEDVGRSGGTYFPLADYGKMHYGAVNVVNASGVKGPISDAAWNDAAVTERSGGVTYATVSKLFGGGHGFNTIWKHE